MNRKLILIILLFFFNLEVIAQENMAQDSCEFHISDTLDQGCWHYDRGMIWTYSSCEIKNFKLLVYDRYGVLVYKTDDIEATHYRSEMIKDGFQGEQLFSWFITGSVLEDGLSKTVDWKGQILYAW